MTTTSLSKPYFWILGALAILSGYPWSFLATLEPVLELAALLLYCGTLVLLLLQSRRQKLHGLEWWAFACGLYLVIHFWIVAGDLSWDEAVWLRAQALWGLALGFGASAWGLRPSWPRMILGGVTLILLTLLLDISLIYFPDENYFLTMVMGIAAVWLFGAGWRIYSGRLSLFAKSPEIAALSLFALAVLLVQRAIYDGLVLGDPEFSTLLVFSGSLSFGVVFGNFPAAPRATPASEMAINEMILSGGALENDEVGFAILEASGHIEIENAVFQNWLGKAPTIGGTPLQQILAEEDFKTFQSALRRGKYFLACGASQLEDCELELEGIPLVGRGHAPRFLLRIRDLTPLQKMEQNKMKQAKNMAVRELIGGVAHDFNNALYGMVLNIKLAQSELEPGSMAGAFLEKSIAAQNQIKGLIEELLLVGANHRYPLESVDLVDVLRIQIQQWKSQLPSWVEVEVSLPFLKGVVQANFVQIQVVLQALWDNALFAMRQKGETIKWSLEHELVSEAEAHERGIRAGEFLCLSLQDSGEGIPLPLQARVFDPFYSTHPKGEARGLGLSKVQGLLQSWGGFIVLQSVLGEGTKVSCYFPIPPMEFHQKASRMKNPNQSRKRILFVDDEPMIAQAGQMILERRGYQVTATSSSQEALEIFKAKGLEIDLVITDQTMPYMTGDQLAKEILKLRNDIPVILATGYSEDLTDHKAKAMGIAVLLQKPLSDQQLLEAIEALLQ